MAKTTFKLVPLNNREAQYYPEGSQELKRQFGDATTQVWVITPEDKKTLLNLLFKDQMK